MAVPSLRFKEFSGQELRKFGFEHLFEFSTGKNIKQNEASPEFEIPCVRYGELYHMYQEVINDVINRTNLDRSELSFSHGDEILLPSAGEDPLDIGSASALKVKNVAIGRTINVLRPTKEGVYSQEFVSFYINQKLRKKIATLAKGVSISNVYNTDLKKLSINLPCLPEQGKIADFLSAVDEKIRLLTEKKEKLETYKKGVMQKLFPKHGQTNPELRFKCPDGSAFPDWEFRKFYEVLNEHGYRSTGNEEVFSVSVHKGLINQIEHLGRSFAAKETGHYNRVLPGDIVYTKSPTGDFPFGIIKQSRVQDEVIVSPLYGVFTPESYSLGYMLNEYFESVANTHNYLHSIIQKGAKNTINITNTTFLSKGLRLPVDLEEQKRVADFLKALNLRIDREQAQIDQMKDFKKGLLQQMFV